MKSKYIEMVLVKELKKTSVWDIRSKRHGYNLGQVKWNPRWRQYCFYPNDATVFNSDCLKSITAFVEKLSKEHWEKIKNEQKRKGKKKKI